MSPNLMCRMPRCRSHRTPPAGSGHPWPCCAAWRGSGRATPPGGTPEPTGPWETAALRIRRARCSPACTCPRSGKRWSLVCRSQSWWEQGIDLLEAHLHSQKDEKRHFLSAGRGRCWNMMKLQKEFGGRTKPLTEIFIRNWRKTE